jgi:metal-responsive CopG/Arc/MetJ family transcriptional regulator
MRLHVHLGDELVDQLDERCGPRERSAFIVNAITRALEFERQWDTLEAAIGSVATRGHAWHTDPQQWVRTERLIELQRSK